MGENNKRLAIPHKVLFGLFAESQGFCAACGEQLITIDEITGKTINYSNVAHIYSVNPVGNEIVYLNEKSNNHQHQINSHENLVLLCYKHHHHIDEVKKDNFSKALSILIDWKNKVNKDYMMSIEKNRYIVIKEIKTILDQIEFQEDIENYETDYNVEDKENKFIKNNIKTKKIKHINSNIDLFYGYIESLIKIRCERHSLSFAKKISYNIGPLYLELSELEEDKNKVLENIKNIIASKYNISYETASIFVDYFIPKCEVLDK